MKGHIISKYLLSMEIMTTQEKLIKSAINLFINRGIDNTPTSLITKKAGFSEASLFVHFKSKQGLIDVIYLESKKRQKEAFAEIKFAQEDATKSLTSLYTTGVKYFISHYNEALFLNQVLNSGHVSCDTKKKLGEEPEVFIKAFNTWKQKCIIKDISFDFYNKLIWSAIFDMTQYCRSKKLKQIPKHLESILWDTLKNN